MTSESISYLWCDPYDAWMRLAIQEAEKAAQKEEVPVGAVIFYKDTIIARAHNQVEMLQDATAHAEIIALTQASTKLSKWRLTDTIMIVTKEPCPMCAGAMVNARIGHLIYGVSDSKAGAAGSMCNLLDNPSLNHHVKVTGGIREQECKDILQKFFLKQRMK